MIEKDLASGKLAELLDADMLLLLTGEKKLYLNYGKDNCEPLDTISVEKARSYIAEGQFAEDVYKRQDWKHAEKAPE